MLILVLKSSIFLQIFIASLSSLLHNTAMHPWPGAGSIVFVGIFTKLIFLYFKFNLFIPAIAKIVPSNLFSKIFLFYFRYFLLNFLSLHQELIF